MTVVTQRGGEAAAIRTRSRLLQTTQFKSQTGEGSEVTSDRVFDLYDAFAVLLQRLRKAEMGGHTSLSPQDIIDRIDPASYDLVSTDLFDTVLLRDLSMEETRLDEAARDAAAKLDLNPDRMSALRRSFHQTAYMAVAAERPKGDASLNAISSAIAVAMGKGSDTAATLRRTEVEMDIRHLTANRPLVEVYARLAKAGKRIVAITDTYYATDEIGLILSEVVGDHPIAAVYASCDIGLTKHAGGLFAEVARREGISLSRILHIGDDPRADVHQALVAGCLAVHLPRAVSWRRAGKAATRLSDLVSRIGINHGHVA